ncbi:MAG: SUMF1/EgtB/PvdO family nonheme iron enzyme [Myxococcota bacterium]|nr:SUMF1/EgtB/PvdO family nonheme iron enzyme [Myxococcota bacterium]
MTVQSISILMVLGLLLSCADGIEPPAGTQLIFLAGTGEMTFQVGQRMRSPCGRFRVETERNPETGIQRFGFTLPADDATESERIVHDVKVMDFCMDVHEVTVRQYEHCVLRGSCEQPQLTNAGDDDRPGFVARYFTQPEKYANHPVVGVSQAGAQGYCAFRGGRLPTEVEWEYAARSRGERSQVWAQDTVASQIDGGCRENRGDIAVGGCAEGLQRVGQSALDVTQDGIKDLAGNVAEWTADAYDVLAYCGQSQPLNLSLDDVFNRASGADVTYVAHEGRLLNPNAACLMVAGTDDVYTGTCRDAFEMCRGLTCDAKIKADINADQSEAVDCLMGCFDAFEQCIQPCVQPDIYTLCARQGNQNACRPTPWCAPRTGWSSQQALAPSISTEREAQFTVRGGHFQSRSACDARPTRRRGEALGTSTVGFRCVYEANAPACRAAQL